MNGKVKDKYNKRIWYLTYNESPSGIYRSQVVDVVYFLKDKLNKNIRLISFISLKGFNKNRKIIRKEMPDAYVIPIIPKIRSVKLNSIIFFIIAYFYKPYMIISRGVHATNFAIKLRKYELVHRVCFDARGARTEEVAEYHNGGKIKEKIEVMERNALFNSDKMISISSKLIDFWIQKYNYERKNHHVVIPCTIYSRKIYKEMSEANIIKMRSKLGYNQNDIILVYAGGTSKWQSIDFMDKYLNNILNNNKKVKVLLLSKIKSEDLKLCRNFPQNVKINWVEPDEVFSILSICDYGVLLRENTITNYVAAPTKFTEYLLAGLNSIISENIGDYSDFVRRNNCGFVVDGNCNIAEKLIPITYEERLRIRELAIKHFSKRSYTKNYEYIINA